MNTKGIDIVVPSFRLIENIILQIAELPPPAGYSLQYYVVADDPKAAIPSGVQALRNAGRIHLLQNTKNEGPSVARNKGIAKGDGKWILLLDDDIIPDSRLLLAYATAIDQHPDALGFAGPCIFPAAFNATTLALRINGSVGHFEAPLIADAVRWAPTANVMLNREKLADQWFDPAFRAGEDIDFLVRNSLRFGEKYLCVPDAIVRHPWWNNGHDQTKRQFQYGVGASQIAAKTPIRDYTYRDFTNTVETILLWVLFLPIAALAGWFKITLLFLPCLLLAEWLTNWLKAIFTNKQYSPIVATQLMLIKNSREWGYLFGAMSTLRPGGFAERIDMGFEKKHPGSFRLNRWKIVKTLLLIAMYLLVTV